MVDIRIVRVGVAQRHMPVPMRMRLHIRTFVRVLVMNIVRMAMCVLQRLMLMFMPMLLCEVHPNAKTHQRCGSKQFEGQRLTENWQRQGRSYEWSGRKVGAGSRRTQVPQA